MPPGQKGTGRKGKDVRQSRSRNSTPSLVGGSNSLESVDRTPYLKLPVESFKLSACDEISELNGSTIPSSKDLELLMKQLNRLVEALDSRGSMCDRGMRLLAQARKDRVEELESDRKEQEIKDRSKREAADDDERGRNKPHKLKRKDMSRPREERPLTHGAHGLPPQDGTKHGTSSPVRAQAGRKPDRKLSNDMDSLSSSLSPATTPAADVHGKKNTKTDDDDSSSADERQPPPASAILNLKTFGDDPSTYPDPTNYEIRAVQSGMTDEDIKKICSVADYPHDDLHDLIPGTPPDKDLSNAKPSNQVQANTYATYLDQYFRPYNEEDLSFLRDRGDRTTPFVIPRRGKKHYTEVWVEEDGTMSFDTPQHGRDKLPANQARGNIDGLDDATAETDQISTGPVLSRLLQTMRVEHRAPPSEDKPMTNGFTNGEASVSGEANGDPEHDRSLNDAAAPMAPATYMTESSSEAWKKANHPKLDYAQVDERIKQELRHIGFFPPDVEPDYDAHYDDEVAARLRYLQGQLKEKAITNGARKARIQQLVSERMAHQEYNNILEDLDNQVQTAYQKRTRTIGKSKKAKKPGGAGGGIHVVGGAGTARPGIGDSTKSLMERRRRWKDTVSVIFEDERALGQVPRSADEGSSIFKPEDMAEFIKKETESWEEEGEEE